jgi:ectoine hydroxylase-related dioxygenase (phytanoyl-CoA dioxygenase family)
VKVTTEQVLAELGAGPDTLTDEERASMDRDGYVVFPELLDADTVEEVRGRLRELKSAHEDRLYAEDPGGSRIPFLHHKGPVFDRLWLEPRLLACVAHWVRDFRLTEMTTRTALPHHGHQSMHIDWWWGSVADEYLACNSTWMLDDFTIANGATRVVPGSHKWGKRPEEVMDDLRAEHPEEVRVEGPAGSLVVFNAYTWHSGTLNTTDRPRSGVFMTFGRRDQPWESGPETALVDAETKARLDPAALYVLDALSAAPGAGQADDSAVAQ